MLWDADGVLQHLPDGIEASMRPVVGDRVEDVETFLAEAVAAERPALAGEVRWLDVLPRLLERWGVADRYDEALAVWLTIEPVPATRELVGRLRAAGVRCCLATNQDVHRGGHMHETFGYAALFDETFYSHDLGVAKPDPAYFTAILDRLEQPAAEVLFVDDNAANVESARTVGLAAVLWHVDDGVPALLEQLRAYDLPV